MRDSEVLVRGNWRGYGPSHASVGWLLRLSGVRGWLLGAGDDAFGGCEVAVETNAGFVWCGVECVRGDSGANVVVVVVMW